MVAVATFTLALAFAAPIPRAAQTALPLIAVAAAAPATPAGSPAAGGTSGATAPASGASSGPAAGSPPGGNGTPGGNGGNGGGDNGASEDNQSPPGPSRLPGLNSRPSNLPGFPRAPADPNQRRAWLKTAIDEVLSAPSFSKAKLGVYVIEGDTGKPVYQRGERVGLNAASNVKIVTSAAALTLLGPEYRWKTLLYAVGSKGTAVAPGGELPGDVYLRGLGDPTLVTEDLAAMAQDLAALGVRRVKGAILADESFFDGTHLPPAYDQRTDSTVSRAAASALSLNANVVAVTIVPASKAGGAAKVLVDPPSPYFIINGRVVTTTRGPAQTNVETRDDPSGRTVVVVSGRVRLGSDARTIRRRVTNPSLYAAYTLKSLLERRGIWVGQTPRLATLPSSGTRVLAAHDSAPLAVVVHDLNKRSNNLTAEQVVRTLGAEIVGRPGTWDKGLEAIGRFMQALGIAKGSYTMTNGSGLYDSNKFTPEQLTTVLRHAMRDFRVSAEFTASLGIAGTDGTIAHRMANTLAERYVRAKTGTLANVSCLSGYAGSPGHPPLIFSILMNDVPSNGEARRAQDRIAELLVAYVEADAARKL